MRNKNSKWPSVGHFGFYFCKFNHGLSSCESLYAWSSYFALILSYVKNITKLLKFKKATRPTFQNCLLPKGNQVIDWHCCTYLPNKQKICWKLFPEISLLVALVIKGLKIWESKWHQKSSGVIWWLCEVWGSRIDRDNQKIKNNGRTGGHLGFYNCEICHGLSLCETYITFCFIFMVQLFCIFLS